MAIVRFDLRRLKVLLVYAESELRENRCVLGTKGNQGREKKTA